MIKIVLINLPKISLNKWYVGTPWKERAFIKKAFRTIVKSQYRHVFPAGKKYKVRYDFEFMDRPLDCSNAVGGMVKLIEDVLFMDDSPKCVVELTTTSKKGKEKLDKVVVTVEEIE